MQIYTCPKLSAVKDVQNELCTTQTYMVEYINSIECINSNLRITRIKAHRSALSFSVKASNKEKSPQK